MIKINFFKLTRLNLEIWLSIISYDLKCEVT